MCQSDTPMSARPSIHKTYALSRSPRAGHDDDGGCRLGHFIGTRVAVRCVSPLTVSLSLSLSQASTRSQSSVSGCGAYSITLPSFRIACDTCHRWCCTSSCGLRTFSARALSSARYNNGTHGYLLSLDAAHDAYCRLAQCWAYRTQHVKSSIFPLPLSFWCVCTCVACSPPSIGGVWDADCAAVYRAGVVAEAVALSVAAVDHYHDLCASTHARCGLSHLFPSRHLDHLGVDGSHWCVLRKRHAAAMQRARMDGRCCRRGYGRRNDID